MSTIDNTDQTLIDIEAVPRRLGQTQRFVRRLVEQNRIELFKIGKRVMFRPEDVTAWIDSKRVPHEDLSFGCPTTGGNRATGRACQVQQNNPISRSPLQQ